MLKVTSAPLELRGIANYTSKKGNLYYTLNCESADGSPHALYCPKAEALPQGLKKGDIVKVTFEVTYFKGNERLVVDKVERVN
jgi:hypothetical protein